MGGTPKLILVYGAFAQLVSLLGRGSNACFEKRRYFILPLFPPRPLSFCMKSRVTIALLSLYSFSQAQAQTFTDVTPSSIENLWVGANAWGDYDGDGDLDFVISGINANGTMLTTL